jgi:predicted DNA-binding transcriptional regulator YafY
MDQPKLERLLCLMKMLTNNINYSVDELAQKLSISQRTVYRYIDTFKAAGFIIKTTNGVPKLDKSSPYFKDISSLIHFTEEEAYILKSAIENIDENNLIKQNLKRKLYTVYDYKILAHTIIKTKNAQNLHRITDAIENKLQIYLVDYSSSHSNTISTRLIEPFAFTTNYIQIWAYEPQSRTNKLFKLSRISEVNTTPNNWQFEHLHKTGYMDAFRISSEVQLPIKLILTLRAANLLVEEYPLAEKDLTQINTPLVCSYKGIGRFVMGLLNEIEISENQEFYKYIRTEIEKYTHKFSAVKS